LRANHGATQDSTSATTKRGALCRASAISRSGFKCLASDATKATTSSNALSHSRHAAYSGANNATNNFANGF
jgi:hypothetical protein